MSKEIVYNGKRYSSIKALAKEVNIPYQRLLYRLNNCRSVDEAIQFKSRLTILSRDHLGNDYPSLSAMAKAYHLSPRVLITRLNYGWSVKKALTTPTKEYACQDHLGNEFKSQKAMCKHWGVNYRSFTSHICIGWSVEDALTKKKNPSTRNKKCTDHLGNEFDNCRKMYEYWQVPYYTFKQRIHRKWDLEKALTTR